MPASARERPYCLSSVRSNAWCQVGSLVPGFRKAFYATFQVGLKCLASGGPLVLRVREANGARCQKEGVMS